MRIQQSCSIMYEVLEDLAYVLYNDKLPASRTITFLLVATEQLKDDAWSVAHHSLEALNRRRFATHKDDKVRSFDSVFKAFSAPAVEGAAMKVIKLKYFVDGLLIFF